MKSTDNEEFKDAESKDNEEFDELAKSVTDANNKVKWGITQPIKVRDGLKRARQVNFLKAFSEFGTIKEACEAAGINLSTERAWRNNPDKWYKEQFKDASQKFSDTVRGAVRKRALEGVEVPIIGKVQGPLGPEDQIIGHRTQYDSLLLMFLAKKVDPSFREKYEESKPDDKVETVSAMTRITIQLNMMRERQNQKIIEITPIRKELSAETESPQETSVTVSETP